MTHALRLGPSSRRGIRSAPRAPGPDDIDCTQPIQAQPYTAGTDQTLVFAKGERSCLGVGDRRACFFIRTRSEMPSAIGVCQMISIDISALSDVDAS